MGGVGSVFLSHLQAFRRRNASLFYLLLRGYIYVKIFQRPKGRRKRFTYMWGRGLLHLTSFPFLCVMFATYANSTPSSCALLIYIFLLWRSCSFAYAFFVVFSGVFLRGCGFGCVTPPGLSGWTMRLIPNSIFYFFIFFFCIYINIPPPPFYGGASMQTLIIHISPDKPLCWGYPSLYFYIYIFSACAFVGTAESVFIIYITLRAYICYICTSIYLLYYIYYYNIIFLL